MLRFRLATGRPRWTSNIVCRRHRQHPPTRATPPTTREEGRPTLSSKTARVFHTAAPATSARHSSSSSSSSSSRVRGSTSTRIIAVTAKARASSTCSRRFCFLERNLERSNVGIGGGNSSSCVHSLARTRLSTATALGEQQREGSSGTGGDNGLTSFRLTGKPASSPSARSNVTSHEPPWFPLCSSIFVLPGYPLPPP